MTRQQNVTILPFAPEGNFRMSKLFLFSIPEFTNIQNTWRKTLHHILVSSFHMHMLVGTERHLCVFHNLSEAKRRRKCPQKAIRLWLPDYNDNLPRNTPNLHHCFLLCVPLRFAQTSILLRLSDKFLCVFFYPRTFLPTITTFLSFLFVQLRIACGIKWIANKCLLMGG